MSKVTFASLKLKMPNDVKIVKYNNDFIPPKIDLDNQFSELKVNDDYEILYNDKVEIKLGYGLIYDEEYDLVINYNNELIDESIKIDTFIDSNGSEIVVNIANVGNKIIKLKKGDTLLKLNSVKKIRLE